MKIISRYTELEDGEFGNSLHIDITTKENKVFNDELWLYNWCFDLIEEIGMKFLDNNLQLRYYKGRSFETEGFSGIGFLTTSSFSIHCSEHYSKVYLDLFSCCPISIGKISKFISETLNTTEMKFVFLNR